MGCDIHAWVEIKRKHDDTWQKVGAQFPCPYYNADLPTITYVEDEGGDWESNAPMTDQVFVNRNYDVFALFADVRNGTGFAGVLTGDRIEPISEPRGIPEDASAWIKREWERAGEHTPSWLGLRELLDWDYDKPKKYIGVLSEDQYEAMKRGVEPTSWSGDISGPGILVMEQSEYENAKLVGKMPTHAENRWQGRYAVTRIHVRAVWDVEGGLRAALGKTYFEELDMLASKFDPDATRIVFWFDS